MKTDIYLSLLLLCNIFIFENIVAAQNINGDTIYVNSISRVEVIFPDTLNKALLLKQDGSYEVMEGTTNSILLRASKKDTKAQTLIIQEGAREHKLIMAYNEKLPSLRYDWSDIRKIETKVKEKESLQSIATPLPTNLIDSVVKPEQKLRPKEIRDLLAQGDKLFNLKAWKAAEAVYLKLERGGIKEKEMKKVIARLTEIQNSVKQEVDKEYNQLMNEGVRLFKLERLEESEQIYFKVLKLKPNDSLAKTNLEVVDDKIYKYYLIKGQEADKFKKYLVAKEYYEKALDRRSDDLLRKRLEQIIEVSNSITYDEQKNKGDLAFNLYDLRGAKVAYDSALAVKPNDRYILNQLVKLNKLQLEAGRDKVGESKYYSLLINAKRLADTAVTKQDYDMAIAAYEKASQMFRNRKFPKEKISALKITIANKK